MEATLYDTANQFRFEYNDTKIAKTVTLDAKYTGVDGQLYDGLITLEPFSSAILIKDTGTVTATAARGATAEDNARHCKHFRKQNTAP